MRPLYHCNMMQPTTAITLLFVSLLCSLVESVPWSIPSSSVLPLFAYEYGPSSFTLSNLSIAQSFSEPVVFSPCWKLLTMTSSSNPLLSSASSSSFFQSKFSDLNRTLSTLWPRSGIATANCSVMIEAGALYVLLHGLTITASSFLTSTSFNFMGLGSSDGLFDASSTLTDIGFRVSGNGWQVTAFTVSSIKVSLNGFFTSDPVNSACVVSVLTKSATCNLLVTLNFLSSKPQLSLLVKNVSLAYASTTSDPIAGPNNAKTFLYGNFITAYTVANAFQDAGLSLSNLPTSSFYSSGVNALSSIGISSFFHKYDKPNARTITAFKFSLPSFSIFNNAFTLTSASLHVMHSCPTSSSSSSSPSSSPISGSSCKFIAVPSGRLQVGGATIPFNLQSGGTFTATLPGATLGDASGSSSGTIPGVDLSSDVMPNPMPFLSGAASSRVTGANPFSYLDSFGQPDFERDFPISTQSLTFTLSDLFSSVLSAAASLTGLQADIPATSFPFFSASLSLTKFSVSISAIDVAATLNLAFGSSSVAVTAELLYQSSPSSIGVLSFSLSLNIDSFLRQLTGTACGLVANQFSVVYSTSTYAFSAAPSVVPSWVSALPQPSPLTSLSAGTTICAVVTLSNTTTINQLMNSWLSNPTFFVEFVVLRSMTGAPNGFTYSLAYLTSFNIGPVMLSNPFITFSTWIAPPQMSFTIGGSVTITSIPGLSALVASVSLVIGPSKQELSLTLFLAQWQNPFGCQGLILSNLLLSVSLMAEFPYIAGFQMAGSMALGSFQATVAGGVNLQDSSNDFFFVQFTQVTISSLLSTLGVKSTLPAFLAGSGFPQGLLVSYSASMTPQTIGTLTVPSGYQMNGAFDFLGVTSAFNLQFSTAGVVIQMSLSVVPLGSNFLLICKSQNDCANGPVFSFVGSTSNPAAVTLVASAYVKFGPAYAPASLSISATTFSLTTSLQLFGLGYVSVIVTGDLTSSPSSFAEVDLNVALNFTSTQLAAIQNTIAADLQSAQATINTALSQGSTIVNNGNNALNNIVSGLSSASSACVIHCPSLQNSGYHTSSVNYTINRNGRPTLPYRASAHAIMKTEADYRRAHDAATDRDRYFHGNHSQFSLQSWFDPIGWFNSAESTLSGDFSSLSNWVSSEASSGYHSVSAVGTRLAGSVLTGVCDATNVLCSGAFACLTGVVVAAQAEALISNAILTGITLMNNAIANLLTNGVLLISVQSLSAQLTAVASTLSQSASFNIALTYTFKGNANTVSTTVNVNAASLKSLIQSVVRAAWSQISSLAYNGLSASAGVMPTVLGIVSDPYNDATTHIAVADTDVSRIATTQLQSQPRGGGNTQYLDRHWVDCGGFSSSGAATAGAIRTWRYNTFISGSTSKFSYACTADNMIAGIYSKNTGWNDNGNGKSVYLDRHVVDCNGGPLLDFQLVNNYATSPNSWRFQYHCGSNQLAGLTTLNTPYDSDGGGAAIYLDRHTLACDPKNDGQTGYVLSYFQLVRDIPNGHMSFLYKCGYLSGASTIPSGASIGSMGASLFSPNGRYLASLSASNSLTVTDRLTSQILYTTTVASIPSMFDLGNGASINFDNQGQLTVKSSSGTIEFSSPAYPDPAITVSTALLTNVMYPAYAHGSGWTPLLVDQFCSTGWDMTHGWLSPNSQLTSCQLWCVGYAYMEYNINLNCRCANTTLGSCTTSAHNVIYALSNAPVGNLFGPALFSTFSLGCPTSGCTQYSSLIKSQNACLSDPTCLAVTCNSTVLDSCSPRGSAFGSPSAIGEVTFINNVYSSFSSGVPSSSSVGCPASNCHQYSSLYAAENACLADTTCQAVTCADSSLTSCSPRASSTPSVSLIGEISFFIAVTCSCNSVNSIASSYGGDNGYTCSDHTIGTCASNQICASTFWKKGAANATFCQLNPTVPSTQAYTLPLSVSNVLSSGSFLSPLGSQSSLVSSNGWYILRFDLTGSIALYNSVGGSPYWFTGDSLPNLNAAQLLMQSDCSLVVNTAAGSTARTIASHKGSTGCYLTIQPDRNAVVYTPTGTPIWATGTDCSTCTVPVPLTLSSLGYQQMLAGGSNLTSPNGLYIASMSRGPSGALTVYTSTGLFVWQLATGGDYLVMRPDCNLVAQKIGSPTTAWESLTQRPVETFCSLTIDDSGTLRITTSDNFVVWTQTTTRNTLFNPQASHSQPVPTGSSVVSSNGLYSLSVGPDVRIVNTESGVIVWENFAATSYLIAQPDNNLVSYVTSSSAITPTWAAGTYQLAVGPSYAKLTNGGVINIIDATGLVVYQAGLGQSGSTPLTNFNDVPPPGLGVGTGTGTGSSTAAGEQGEQTKIVVATLIPLAVICIVLAGYLYWRQKRAAKQEAAAHQIRRDQLTSDHDAVTDNVELVMMPKVLCQPPSNASPNKEMSIPELEEGPLHFHECPLQEPTQA